MNRTACRDAVAAKNQEILVIGWVQKIRKLGHLTFIDVRDQTALVQVVCQVKQTNFAKIVAQIQLETLVQVQGTVVERKRPNHQLVTGAVEIIPQKLEILSQSSVLPFVIDNEPTANEDLRLQYRYLDLRRLKLQPKFSFTQ